MGTFLMPHTFQGSINEGRLPILLLALPILLELSKRGSRQAGSQAVKVSKGGGHFGAKNLRRVPLRFQ
eukprot:1299388-Amphidinium_carterae.1